MRELFNRVASNDSVVKALFDHVRNAGISGAVLFAVYWTYKHMLSPSLAQGAYAPAIISGIAAVALLVFGLFLFFVNQSNGLQKLKQWDGPKWVYQLVIATYSMVIVTIMASLVAR